MLEARGLTVLCEDFRKYDPSDLPGLPKGETPDVYFWWPMHAAMQNEEWMLHIRDALWENGLGKGKRVVIAFDHNWAADRASLANLKAKYGEAMRAEEYTVDYAEGRHWRASGTFSLLHLHLDPMPSPH